MTTLSKLAQHALRATKNEREAAVDFLVTLLKKNPGVLQEALHTIARQAILGLQSSQRSSLVVQAVAQASAAASKLGDARGAFAYSEALARGFLDGYALPNGVLLGNATVDDLRHGINHHKTLAKASVSAAAFLERVLKRMKPGKKVREVLQESDLKALNVE